MTRLPIAVLVVLVFAVGVAVASPAGDNIVINEIYCDGAGYYDGSEFIELYNPTGATIVISGWVLTGIEYNETCGGEDLWQFPLVPEVSIPAGGYLVVAKDGDESTVPESDDSFYWEFGFYPEFEQYDAEPYFEVDSPYVANMVILTNETATNYSDEIQLVGGRGYGVICTPATSDADAVYLYDGDPSSGPANLVDLVEYIDGDECSTDPCVYPFSDDGADDNAFVGVPFLGNSLGRDTAGSDTDMSIDDWTMQAPTPAAQNVPNTPPWIRTLTYAPIPPIETDDVTISAYVTDDSSVDSVMVYYNIDNSGWNTVEATTGDSLYSGAIPAVALYDGAVVQYFMRAVDDLGAVMNYPSEAMSRPYSLRIGITPIYDIQFVSAGGDTSGFDGEPVNVQGIVTLASGEIDDDLFYMHDGTGEFRGIVCYMGGEPTPVQEGDLVTFCGRVSEYYGLTEITRHFEGSMVIESSGNPHYGFTDVTTAQVTYNDLASEPYEAQLIRVTDATVTLESGAYGIWYCADSSILNAKVDDEVYYTYDPEVGDVLEELRGVLLYDYSEYKIQPRSDDDILGPPRISDIHYSPVPPAASVATTISATLDDNAGI
ncbi:MAG TPA: lamin tail domain-containing protein, partial [bacterium]|nr:lamin tail domain-containing protein [bacterium]